MRLIWALVLVVTVQALTGCKAYKRDLMLQFDEGFSAEDIERSINRATDNYVIKPGDYVVVFIAEAEGQTLRGTAISKSSMVEFYSATRGSQGL